MEVYTGIDWVENAEIHKSYGCKTIRILKDENSAEIIIDEKEEKATIKISDGRFGSLSVKKGVRDGLLYIYRVPVSEKTGVVARTATKEIPLPGTIIRESGRYVLHLPAEVAPVQVAVLPLLTREELIDPAIKIVDILRRSGIFVSYDDAGTIGRRYRRNDEIGTPFSVTIDYDTLDDGTVTIRDRDSMVQVRVQVRELAERIHAMMRSGFDSTEP
ncbi:MAG: hypothetical protein KAU52_06100 [Methanosarcinales archaeon]|nr:hypothetical protein [Methanosarcinales archaeon]